MRPQKNIDDIVHGIDFEHKDFLPNLVTEIFFLSWLINKSDTSIDYHVNGYNVLLRFFKIHLVTCTMVIKYPYTQYLCDLYVYYFFLEKNERNILNWNFKSQTTGQYVEINMYAL